MTMSMILNPWDYDRWLTSDGDDARKLVGPFLWQIMAERPMPPNKKGATFRQPLVFGPLQNLYV